MKAALQAWLDAPIPRKRALGAVLTSNVGTLLMWASQRVTEHNHKDAEQRVVILKEAVDILLEKADPLVQAELNDKLEFWRIIRGIPNDPE